MSVYRDRRSRSWRFRKTIVLPDGKKQRISGTPQIDSKVAAEAAERAAIERALSGEPTNTPAQEVPTVNEFSETFLELSGVDNRASTVTQKEAALRLHILPLLGELHLDQVGYAEIQDLKVAIIQKKLAKKTANNCLTILRRLLAVAKKRGLITTVPEVEWLRLPAPEFDFLDFEEGGRIIEGSSGEWRTMIVVALRTGLRQGELLGLRWEDVDLKAGKLMVRQSIVNGEVGPPKSGKAREVPLSDEARAELKAHRHLRGPLVFCRIDGEALTVANCRGPLAAACKKAGLRHVSWHVLRHSFASHLVMRGAPLKVVQELLGHSTIMMTMRYAHLAPEVSRDAVQLLDRRGNHLPTAQDREAK
jgi:integrase